MDRCPFCGGAAHMHRDTEDERTAYRLVITISCTICRASITRYGDTSKGGYADNSRVEAEALTAWNQRV